MDQKIKVRFKGYDDKLLDKTISEIVHTVKRTGAEIVGPIPQIGRASCRERV